MTPAETDRLLSFLDDQKIAVVATVGKSGAPQLTPLWYGIRDGRITLSTTKQTVKYTNLLRDDRITLCFYSEPAARDFATVWGHAEISDDESIWPETRAIVERYTTPERVEARMRDLRTQNRVIVTLEPDRVLFRT